MIRFFILNILLFFLSGCKDQLFEYPDYSISSENDIISFSPSVNGEYAKMQNSSSINLLLSSGELKGFVDNAKSMSVRSSELVNSFFPEGSSFGVLGYALHGETWDNQADGPQYMYNEKVVRQGESYLSENPLYWPSRPMRFFSYYPYTDENDERGIKLPLKTDKGLPRIHFRLNDDVTKQFDFLVAATPVTNPTSRVDLNFRHALTQIGFSFRKQNMPGEVSITDIEFHNVVNEGTQTFDNNNNIVWEVDHDNVTNYSITDKNGGIKEQIVLQESYQQINTEAGYFMMIPQQIKAGRILLVVKYKIDGFEKELKSVLSVPEQGSVGEWTAGKKINYQITLSEQTNEFVIIPGVVGSANSFILNSQRRSNDPTVNYINFSIPVTRVNEYYNNPEYSRFYGSTTGISGNTRWAVQIIWMDMANLIDIVKRSGIGANPGNDPAGATDYNYNIDPDKNQYDDKGRFWVRCRPGATGNALVGIFKDPNGNGIKDPGEDFIWSWHLWITDYNPNYFNNGNLAITDSGSGAGQWNVPGGTIQRYKNGSSGNDMFGSKSAWAPGSGIYAGLAIMDRNLGAFSDGYPLLQDGASNRPLGALYYQYGRKDPFLSYAYRYTEDGTPINETYTISTNDRRFSAQNIIQQPEIFPITVGGNRYAWANDLPTNIACYWFDPTSIATNPTQTFSFRKSIFDPSPYGWKIPVNGTWSGLSPENSPFVSGFGRIYTPESGIEAKFPAYGFRAAGNGDFVMIGAQSVIWSCSNSNNTAPAAATGRAFYAFRAGNTNALFESTAIGYTTDALSVRPIQDPVNRYPTNRYP